MNLAEMHIRAINQMVENGEMIPSKEIGIVMINLEEFQFSIKESGIVNIAELIKIKEFIDNSIAWIASSCRLLINSHKDSPFYWGKIETNEDDESGEKEYSVSIDLEPFMQKDSKSKTAFEGYIIPDNYHLAKLIIKSFKKAGNKTKGLEEGSYRDLAKWYTKDKVQAEKLVKFIEKKYVSPYVKEVMDFYNIREIKFLEKRMDFVFNEGAVVK